MKTNIGLAKTNKEKITKIFQDLTQKGGFFGFTREEEELPNHLLPVDSFEILKYEENVFWLLFRYQEYHHGDREIHHIRVVSMAPYKDGFLLTGYPAGADDSYDLMTFLVGPLSRQYIRSEKWQKWLKLKAKYKDMFALLEEYSFKMHQSDLVGHNYKQGDAWEWKFSCIRDDLWELINKEGKEGN